MFEQPHQNNHPKDKPSEAPPETLGDSHERAHEIIDQAAKESATLSEYDVRLYNDLHQKSLEEDSDTKDEMLRARRRLEHGALPGHGGMQLDDGENETSTIGKSPHIGSQTAAEIQDSQSADNLDEVANRAQERSRHVRVERVVDPKTGRIISTEEISDGVISSEANEKYRGKGQNREESDYYEQKGTKFVDQYGAAEAFNEFALGTGENAGDRVKLQEHVVKESNIDTADTKRLAKIVDMAGFSKKEKKEFMQEFAEEDDDFALADPEELLDDLDLNEDEEENEGLQEGVFEGDDAPVSFV
ncbi:hypothetical protein HN512_03165 [Candidatus Peregrinibacteria bacterium]|nr:hypothetical protein [Candidatus Peregrinibacteria bacterium]MBT3598813.1 hypothetical protein [Candidatus Peregrinibacteria bacterium]MBT4367201.1 hypothetical protein [Candidatus Peregrinibacteria bacterium]MBT6731177.1 hypothetical protein [Candidatus Peregrinibacteria bacterium]MBT7009217.1 hypothetical protein [Candidatus Peregrinibacteria bacterium]